MLEGVDPKDIAGRCDVSPRVVLRVIRNYKQRDNVEEALKYHVKSPPKKQKKLDDVACGFLANMQLEQGDATYNHIALQAKQVFNIDVSGEDMWMDYARWRSV